MDLTDTHTLYKTDVEQGFTGNYIQYLIITYNGKSLKITFIYIYSYIHN